MATHLPQNPESLSYLQVRNFGLRYRSLSATTVFADQRRKPASKDGDEQVLCALVINKHGI